MLCQKRGAKTVKLVPKGATGSGTGTAVKPENFDFGGGVSESVIHPAVFVAMLLVGVLMLVLPRKYIVVPFLSSCLLIPQGQQLYIAGMHWLVLRIIILIGCVKLVFEKLTNQRTPLFNGINRIDWAFVAWAFYAGLAPILLFGSAGAVPFQMAKWLETFGGYFVLRFLIKTIDDISRAAKTLAVLTVAFSVSMAHERATGINVFGYLGGISLSPEVRAGVIRAQGSFGHSILAGCFGATVAPLFFWLWKTRRARYLALLAIACSTAMTLLCKSSTPVLAYAGGIGALLLWPIRRRMRAVRWGISLTLVCLQAGMNAPIWFVISRINVTGHSDAYDRAMLIDTFVRHFWDWWLIGTNQTGNWGWDMFDLSNQFVAVAERGGLFCFVCFVALISRSFRQLGKQRDDVCCDRNQEWLCWSLGAVLFAHILAYFGVNYFDQSVMWWFAFLAMVSATAGLKTTNTITIQDENAASFWVSARS